MTELLDLDRTLTRFRADPTRVRVSIQHCSAPGPRFTAYWVVTIRSLQRDVFGVMRAHRSPKKALALALRAAERLRIPGIDLGMQWAYYHPQRVVKFEGRA